MPVCQSSSRPEPRIQTPAPTVREDGVRCEGVEIGGVQWQPLELTWDGDYTRLFAAGCRHREGRSWLKQGEDPVSASSVPLSAELMMPRTWKPVFCGSHTNTDVLCRDRVPRKQ
eukprot:350140-Rhodomonas_salina.2